MLQGQNSHAASVWASVWKMKIEKGEKRSSVFPELELREWADSAVGICNKSTKRVSGSRKVWPSGKNKDIPETIMPHSLAIRLLKTVDHKEMVFP